MARIRMTRGPIMKQWKRSRRRFNRCLGGALGPDGAQLPPGSSLSAYISDALLNGTSSFDPAITTQSLTDTIASEAEALQRDVQSATSREPSSSEPNQVRLTDATKIDPMSIVANDYR